MDILDDVLIKFWRTLNNNNVRYIMVGGFAVRFHNDGKISSAARNYLNSINDAIDNALGDTTSPSSL
jgi:hypothetical protein